MNEFERGDIHGQLNITRKDDKALIRTSREKDCWRNGPVVGFDRQLRFVNGTGFESEAPLSLTLEEPGSEDHFVHVHLHVPECISTCSTQSSARSAPFLGFHPQLPGAMSASTSTAHRVGIGGLPLRMRTYLISDCFPIDKIPYLPATLGLLVLIQRLDSGEGLQQLVIS